MISHSFPHTYQTLVDDDERTSSNTVPMQGAYLVLLLEGDRPLAASSRHSLQGAQTVVMGRGARRSARRLPQEYQLKLDVPDRRMSGQHALLTRVRGDWHIEDCDSTNGTRVNGERVVLQRLTSGDLIECGRTSFVFLEDLPSSEPLDLDWNEAPGEYATLDPRLETELKQLKRLAPARDISVLIEGESGVGKEVVARLVAEWAALDGPFIAVNCGALVESLLESELFGVVKGAFSGAARDRVGLIRSADRGCLFLDEVADLPRASQAALLRVLQEREVLAVGATRPHPVALRVVAATHRDLDRLVEQDDFRQDLFARLAGFRIRLPPLRERKLDLGLLVASMLRALSPQSSVRLHGDAIRALYHYDWPLNVRELQNAIGAAFRLSGGETIGVEHLPELVRGSPKRPNSPEPPRPLNSEQQRQRDELLQLLQLHRGNISAIAREMGKARTQIQRWLRRYGLDPESYR